jgi:hypothetical protein
MMTVYLRLRRRIRSALGEVSPTLTGCSAGDLVKRMKAISVKGDGVGAVRDDAAWASG